MARRSGEAPALLQGPKGKGRRSAVKVMKKNKCQKFYEWLNGGYMVVIWWLYAGYMEVIGNIFDIYDWYMYILHV